MAASPAGPGGPGDWGAEGLPVVVWPCDGGLLLQDMRSFGRATGPDLSLGLQSPPPPTHAQHVSLGRCWPMGVILLHPSSGAPPWHLCLIHLELPRRPWWVGWTAKRSRSG